MKRVMLESPYAGNIEKNVKYAKECVNDCLHRGEAPFVSHLLYTQEGILDDTNPLERKLGMDAGHAWLEGSEYVVAYCDLGLSRGMLERMGIAIEKGMKVEIRVLRPENIQVVKDHEVPLFLRVIDQDLDLKKLTNRFKKIAKNLEQGKIISLDDYLLFKEMYSMGANMAGDKNKAV